MHLDKQIQRLIKEAPEVHYVPIGCTNEEIAALELKIEKKLPGALKEYLLWGGHIAGPLDPRYDMSYESFFSLVNNRVAIEYMDDNKKSQPNFKETLPENALVLSTWQGYHFWFICLDENDNDPPVFEWMDNDRISFEKKYAHFSEYFEMIVDGHIKIYKNRVNANSTFDKEMDVVKWNSYLERKSALKKP